MKALIDIFHNTSVEIYEAKKHAFQQGNEELAGQIGQGKDIISLLSIPISFPSIQVLTKFSFSERKYESIRRRETFRRGSLGPNKVSLCISETTHLTASQLSNVCGN